MTTLTSTKTKHLPGILNVVCFYGNIMVPIPSRAEITQATWIMCSHFAAVRPDCIVNAQNAANRGDIIRALQRDCFVKSCRREKRILSGTNIKKRCQTKGRGSMMKAAAAAMWIILQSKGCLPRWKESARNIPASER